MNRVTMYARRTLLKFKWCPLLVMLSWTPGCCTNPEGVRSASAGDQGTASSQLTGDGAWGKLDAHCPACK